MCGKAGRSGAVHKIGGYVMPQTMQPVTPTPHDVLVNIHSEYGTAAALEARRLAEKYQKDFLSCEDIVSIMGIGRNNARQLMSSSSFPTIEVGNRKVVSVIAFTLWSLKSDNDHF